MSRVENKAARLGQIEALLLAHPEGLKAAEIARKLEVHRSTILRCLPDLPKHIFVDDMDEDRWKIDRSNYLTHVRLTLHEITAVHQAARLLATHMDKKNPHAAAAIRKLGASIDRLAPQVSQHLMQSANVMDDEAQRHDPVYLEVMETLTLAWAEGKKVHLWHQHDDGRIYEYDFAPYFIEPYALGRTSHVIGLREPPNAIRTFKIERIKRIERRADPYEIPADFNVQSKLGSAWGIWYTDDEPVRVELKFHPRVARRVMETRWHSSELPTEECADGSVIWRADIAEPKEMLPWIRGWGADVEVIGPDELRVELLREIKRYIHTYHLETAESVTQLNQDADFDDQRASNLFRA